MSQGIGEGEYLERQPECIKLPVNNLFKKQMLQKHLFITKI